MRVCGVRPNVTHVNLHDGPGEFPLATRGLVTAGEVFSVVGALKVNVVWRDSKTLLVERVGCGGQPVLKREAMWKDVRVTFAAK